MQIVIDIPDLDYFDIKHGYADNFQRERLVESVKRSIVIPKNHGRLIDSKLLDKRLNFVLNHTGGYKKTLVGTGIVIAMAENLDAPTVIEAESEGSE